MWLNLKREDLFLYLGAPVKGSIFSLSQIQDIHREQPPAGEAVKKRLETVTPGVAALKTAEEKNQKAYDAWAEKFKKKNGKDPGSKDRYTSSCCTAGLNVYKC